MARKKSNKSEPKVNQTTESPQKTPVNNEELEHLKTDYDKLKAETETQKDQFMRMAAEYDNFRKRTEKEKLSTYDNAVAATVEAFLPVVDNFALALSSNAEVSEEFRKGLEMIQKQLDNAFEKLNVVSFGERGEEFDPELHNAIARTSDEELEEDHITLVYQKGYRIGDKIIRHAMVQISE
ncbi:MAG: nucleotide exchange factor GrpE [Clostridia bacterium]|nr:nucleotide exchange factor GrpE [Clostridia bacterium]